MTQIEVTAEIAWRDLFRFHIANFRRRGVWVSSVAMPVAGILLLACGFQDRLDTGGLIIEIALISFPVYGLGLLGLFSYYQKNETDEFKHPVAFRISDQALTIDTSRGDKVYPWDGMFDCFEDQYAFYLFLSVEESLILPKRYFSGVQQEQVGELLKTPASKRLYKKGRIVSVVMALFTVLIAVAFLLFV